jgi:hypothetical protein
MLAILHGGKGNWIRVMAGYGIRFAKCGRIDDAVSQWVSPFLVEFCVYRKLDTTIVVVKAALGGLHHHYVGI